MRPLPRLFAFLAVNVALLGAASRALALEPEVTSDTSAQFYDVRSPTGQTIVARRRLTTTLGVGAYDLLGNQASPDRLGKKPLPELTFRARLRYDADYGPGGGSEDPNNNDLLVPGFSRGPVDLMYAYIEGRKFAGGWLGFKLGRQYVVDSLGWWSFDGGLVRVTTPFYFALEGYGGFEVRGGMPLSSPRFEGAGVWRGDRGGYDPSLYPAFQPAQIAPAMGFALESTGFTWLHGRFTYRRVYNTGGSSVSQFTSGLRPPVDYDETRISQERIGYGVDGTLPNVGGARAGFAYDLYMAKMANIFGSIDAFVTPRLTLSLDYDYYSPTYDADSIWNFFAGSPTNDIAARASWDIRDDLAVAGRFNVRVFQTQTSSFHANSSPNINPSADANDYPSSGATFDEGGYLSVTQKQGENVHGLRANGNFGKEGNRMGGDLFVNRVYDGRYLFEGRGSIWHWDDRLRPDRDATSYGFVAAVGYRMAPRSKVLFEYQADVNRLSGVRSRAMIWLTVAVTR
ncbi:hypothetical protein [Pendulispora albinea]|uniref:Uncharacterized protein n=1 Tax=Pendulispora albinea TaxID=2741071 RepID=A0ABZ2M518_9BACT